MDGSNSGISGIVGMKPGEHVFMMYSHRFGIFKECMIFFLPPNVRGYKTNHSGNILGHINNNDDLGVSYHVVAPQNGNFDKEIDDEPADGIGYTIFKHTHMENPLVSLGNDLRFSKSMMNFHVENQPYVEIMFRTGNSWITMPFWENRRR